MVKYCPSCGAELEDDSKFCENCGNQIFKSRIPSEINSVNPKLKIIIPLIGVLLILGVLCAGFFIFSDNPMPLLSNDLIEVTEVCVPNSGTMKYVNYYAVGQYVLTDSGNTAFEETLQFTFKVDETIDQIVHIKLDDIVLTFEDGSKLNMDPVQKLGYDTNLNDNSRLVGTHTLLGNGIYSLNFRPVINIGDYETNKNKMATMKHLTATVLIDTQTESDKIIGHIDNDIIWYDKNRNNYIANYTN